MSKRLQVLLDEAELIEIQRVARQHDMTVASWVRQTLREARSRQPIESAERKLEAVRRAAHHHFPTAPIDQMLAEIESGYVDQPDG